MLKRHLNAGGDFILVTHNGMRLWIRRNTEGHADLLIEHDGEKLNIGLGREKREGRIQFYGTFDGPHSFVITPSQHLTEQRGSGQDDRPESQQVLHGGTETAPSLQPKRAS